MKDYLDGHSLMHPLSDGSWVIDEDPFYYVSNGVKIRFIKDTVPDPETKAFLEKFRKNTSRSISNVRDFVAPLSEIGKRKDCTLPEIKKVIFNDPATIVLWADGTKTVVKCFEGDVYTKWAGLAFCICKKMMGDNFHKDFRRWCGEDEIRSPIEEPSKYGSSISNDLTRDFMNNIRELFLGKNPTKDI